MAHDSTIEDLRRALETTADRRTQCKIIHLLQQLPRRGQDRGGVPRAASSKASFAGHTTAGHRYWLRPATLSTVTFGTGDQANADRMKKRNQIKPGHLKVKRISGLLSLTLQNYHFTEEEAEISDYFSPPHAHDRCGTKSLRVHFGSEGPVRISLTTALNSVSALPHLIKTPDTRPILHTTCWQQRSCRAETKHATQL